MRPFLTYGATFLITLLIPSPLTVLGVPIAPSALEQLPNTSHQHAAIQFRDPLPQSPGMQGDQTSNEVREELAELRETLEAMQAELPAANEEVREMENKYEAAQR